MAILGQKKKKKKKKFLDVRGNHIDRKSLQNHSNTIQIPSYPVVHRRSLIHFNTF